MRGGKERETYADGRERREEKEARRASMHVKKAAVTSTEAALIAELLQTGSFFTLKVPVK